MDGNRRLLETLSEPTLLLSGKGTLIAVNSLAARLLSSGPESLKGNSLLEYLTTPSDKFLDYLRICTRNSQPVLGSFSLTTQAGEMAVTTQGAVLEPRTATTEAVILLQIFPQVESNKRFVLLNERISELNKEITKRQRMEYDLRRQKEWLQVTLASIGDAVIVTDAKGVVTFMNPVAERLTGWEKDLALGKSLNDVFRVIDEKSRKLVESPVDHVLQKERIVSLASNSLLVAKDGSEIPVADTAAPIHVESRLEGVILVFHDVTEKRNLQNELAERAEKLEEANRRKNEFLVMLAHELRNPLAPISNAVELLQVQEGPPELSVQAREILVRQVQHLTRITDDLLDVSRVMRGRVALAASRLNLSDLLRDVYQDNKPRFMHNRVQLNLSVPEKPVWVNADSTRLNQVFENLLSNACKFTRESGQVDISLMEKEEHAVVTVADTGVGVPMETMPYLFEPFAQAEQSLARSGGGLGLGLSIVKGLIELHKGKVFVESEGKDKGATFTVMLPLAEIKDERPASKAQATDVEGHRVLLIEDNPDAALSLQLLLDCLGHDVHIATEGFEGIEIARRLKPHVIICDIGLPDLDGFAVAERLRADPETSSVLLVALTGYGDKSFEARAKRAGFDIHLIKPVKAEIIQKVIKTLH